MIRTVNIFGGGTFSHVRAHLALAAPAFGETARRLSKIMGVVEGADPERREVRLHLTKMADHTSTLVTNEDVDARITTLLADPATGTIVLNAALCDYDGMVTGDLVGHSGKYAERLRTDGGDRMMRLTPAPKLLSNIRKERKDVFLVAFKTTAGATPEQQYSRALHLLKANSVNLVLANDLITRHNMIVTPEEFHYDYGEDRTTALVELAYMTSRRSRNTFTRSTVVSPDAYPWDGDAVPANLRAVVEHCIARGAYKPFRGATVGHFAARIPGDQTLLTSRRKDDFNFLPERGMVLCDYGDGDTVSARGGKPSVGGMSQRIIFREHRDKDCIVHFHSPLRPDAPDAERIGGAEQQWVECGSHQCGQQTSDTLTEVFPGIAATHLRGHGPNIVFSKDVPAERVIQFIEANWALEEKTGGLVA